MNATMSDQPSAPTAPSAPASPLERAQAAMRAVEQSGDASLEERARLLSAAQQALAALLAEPSAADVDPGDVDPAAAPQ